MPDTPLVIAIAAIAAVALILAVAALLGDNE